MLPFKKFQLYCALLCWWKLKIFNYIRFLAWHENCTNFHLTVRNFCYAAKLHKSIIPLSETNYICQIYISMYSACICF
jgi:hypothetical protein